MFQAYLEFAKLPQVQTIVQIFLSFNTFYFFLSSIYETNKIRHKAYADNLDAFRGIYMAFHNTIFCLFMLPVANSTFITFIEVSNLLPLFYRFNIVCKVKKMSFLQVVSTGILEYITSLINFFKKIKNKCLNIYLK